MYRAMQISQGKHSRLWEEQCKGPGAGEILAGNVSGTAEKLRELKKTYSLLEVKKKRNTLSV